MAGNRRLPLDVGLRTSLSYKLGCHDTFVFPHILLAEEELPVKVGDINRVKIDDVDVLDTKHRDVLEHLAS